VERSRVGPSAVVRPAAGGRAGGPGSRSRPGRVPSVYAGPYRASGDPH